MTDETEKPLPARLREAFGRMEPEGDGWSHEWRVNPLAEEAARRIEDLEALAGNRLEELEATYVRGFADGVRRTAGKLSALLATLQPLPEDWDA